jgi:hypothetical protein
VLILVKQNEKGHPVTKTLEQLIKDPSNLDNKKGVYAIWKKQNRRLVLSLESKSKKELFESLLTKLFEYECLKIIYGSVENLNDTYDKYIDRLNEYSLSRSKVAALQMEEKNLLLAQEKEHRYKATHGLDIGRSLATAKRKANALGKEQSVQAVIDDLYRQGSGWKMTYPEIVKYLIDRKIASYKPEVMLKKVKKFAPTIKAKYKSGQ